MINDNLSKLLLDASNSTYSLGAQSVPTGYEIERVFDDPSTGFKAVAFVNRSTNERILAFTGTEKKKWGQAWLIA